MGAGMSRRQKYTRVYSRLKAFEYKLRRAGQACAYKDWALKGTLENGTEFSIAFSFLSASNGECAAALRCRIGTKIYGGWCTDKQDGSFEEGLELLIAGAGKRPAVPVDLVPV